MTTYRSDVQGDHDAPVDLGELFPTYLPEPEVDVYEHVLAATKAAYYFPPDEAAGPELPMAFAPPRLSFYSPARPDMPAIPVVRGWPAYPGAVPAIGVAVGNDTSDQQGESMQGGFAGQQVRHDDFGNIVGGADYYAEPLFASVIVELIHENRDERDRLHNELRRVLFPLRRLLPDRNELYKRVSVSGEKQELPLDEQPLTIYVSLFTVEVHYEMLEATNIVGPDGFIERLDITVNPIEES